MAIVKSEVLSVVREDELNHPLPSDIKVEVEFMGVCGFPENAAVKAEDSDVDVGEEEFAPCYMECDPLLAGAVMEKEEEAEEDIFIDLPAAAGEFIVLDEHDVLPPLFQEVAVIEQGYRLDNQDGEWEIGAEQVIEEAAEEEAAWPGVDSGIDSDAETIENVFDDGRDPDFDPAAVPEEEEEAETGAEDEDEEEARGGLRNIVIIMPPEEISDSDSEYDYVLSSEREATLRRLYALKRHYWRTQRTVLKEMRRQDLKQVKRKILRLKHRRIVFEQHVPRDERPQPGPEFERPRRNNDFCHGCGRVFYCQRTRRWSRCETCGDWLCPNCNERPQHCQDEDLAM